MNCPEARKWISPYLDSELGQTKTFEISEHLQQCADCAGRFNAERRVDAMIRDRLEPEPMPADLWTAIQQSSVVPSSFRWMRWGGRFSVAAVLAIAAVVYWPDAAPPVAAPRIVSEFVTTVPDNEAFATSVNPNAVMESVSNLLGREFGLLLPAPGEQPAGEHVSFELVSANLRWDQDGREYVEVRLNCCGEPVLVAFARDTGGVLPQLFEGLPLYDELKEQQHDGVRVASRPIAGGLAVITSRHPVAHILGGLRQTGV